MSELRPYSYGPPPLTGGARFVRGFKRIGLVLGFIILIGGTGMSISSGVNQQSYHEARYPQAACVLDKLRNRYPVKTESYDANKIDPSASGCPGPMYSETAQTFIAEAQHKPAPLEYIIEPVYLGSLWSVGIATVVFVSFWLVGWLCAGFTRD